MRIVRTVAPRKAGELAAQPWGDIAVLLSILSDEQIPLISIPKRCALRSSVAAIATAITTDDERLKPAALDLARDAPEAGLELPCGLRANDSRRPQVIIRARSSMNARVRMCGLGNGILRVRRSRRGQARLGQWTLVRAGCSDQSNGWEDSAGQTSQASPGQDSAGAVQETDRIAAMCSRHLVIAGESSGSGLTPTTWGTRLRIIRAPRKPPTSKALCATTSRCGHPAS